MTSSEPVLLEVRDVSVHYGRIQALHGVSLQVHQGELVTLLGSNGAGKTTMMRALSGLLPLFWQLWLLELSFLPCLSRKGVSLPPLPSVKVL